MEKEFLLYLMYITFVEMREHAHKINDKIFFWLCDLLHNVPLNMGSEESVQSTYNRLVENAKTLGMQKWLEKRKEEFDSENNGQEGRVSDLIFAKQELVKQLKAGSVKR